jgi:DnaK suppressor protein
VDPQRARELLEAERERLRELLQSTYDESSDDRAGASELGDMFDPAESLTAEEQADAIALGLRQRLATVERAERRLDDGTYGFSVRSGEPIPDDRLEADPAAELTVEEASER